MDEPRHDPLPPPEPVLWLAPPEVTAGEAELRRRLRRRLALLLIAGLALFTLIAWMLVRLDLAGLATGARGPAGVVRGHLEALNRNDLRAAWEYFSEGYRAKLPFERYHDVIVQHRTAFLTRQVEFRERDEDAGRTVLTARVTAADGTPYLARFTLVRSDGRWWIDDLRWRPERRPGSLTI